MKPSNLKRKCPICDSVTGHILNTQKFILSDNHPLKNGYDVVSCVSCGFVYADTDAVQEDYDRFYNDFSKYEEGANVIGSGTSYFDNIRLRETAQYLFKMVGTEKKIIDVGSAKGGLLREFQKNGYQNLYAYDPSGYCVDSIKKEMGIEAIKGSIFNIRENFGENKTFDFVILTHVLEHLFDIPSAFKQIHYLLDKGSDLYIEVPDATQYEKYFVNPFHFFDTEHINHFSLHYLKMLADQYGFIIIDEGEKEIPLSDNTIYPAIYVLLKKKKNIQKAHSTKIKYDDSLTANIKKYITKSHETLNLELIERISTDPREFIFWGVGNTTLRLLASTNLKNARIKFFVDNNPKTQSTKVMGKGVYPPTELKDHREPIVIFTKIYKNEIAKQIREDLKIENELIFLN